ncbi:MAG: cadherin-like beta sandwich domain-containing protein, partial [Clostridia bacterium]|nr:cadherin-like beta sandwich domain-containing protein [Clostridia bacterium]
PMFIDMDWDYVIDQEAQPQSNYINADMPESHRSTLPGSYDWTTDTWVKRGNKYDASKEIISYYMDPRNFLDERYIFQFESLSYDPSVHTLSGVEQMIQKINFMKGKEIKNSNGEEISYAQAYMDAAEKSKVSPYHLVARTRQEVGVNGSESVSGTESGYKGIYNFYNIQATGSWKDGLEWASKSGTWGRPWNTQYKSVVNGADWIGSGYINKGQNTLYFEKFHVVGSDPNDLFWHQYMQTLTAPYSEASTIYSAYQDMGMLSSALSFIIPVYKNMPEEKCTTPTATGSPNTWLKTLEVEGHSITPSFECNGSTDYSLIVASNVAQIKVKATAVSDSAIINDGATRTIDLEMGTNTVNIRVRAGNGDIKTYVLTVVREEGGNIPEPPIGGEDVIPPGYEINSAYAVQNGKISGIEIGTTLEEIKNNLGLKGNATAAFYNADGSAITDETIRAATGITVKISAGAIDVFTLLVYGDANGDGEINAIDLLMVRRNILGSYKIVQ